MTKHCVISHSQDPDGIIAQALILMYIKRTYDGIQSIDNFLLDYPELPEFFSNKSFEKYNYIYILDLPLSEKAISDERLEQISKSSSLMCYDHHIISDNRKVLLNRICMKFAITEDKCTSRIITELLQLNSEYALFLSDIAQSYDFNISGAGFTIAEKLRRIISCSSKEDLGELIDDITNNNWLDNNMNLRFKYKVKEESVLKEEIKAYKIIDETAETFILGSKKIVIAFSPKILYMKPGMRYLETRYNDLDGVILLCEGKSNVLLGGINNVSEKIVPMLPYCIYKGGGGRNNAGGFTIEEIISQNNYKDLKEEIITDFRLFFDKIKYSNKMN
jgi:oligoribonuclease NrnB/cAMP/cGMP phosphodiesterase (DHH superfamily)